MLTNNETEENFAEFYIGIRDVANDVGIDFEPKFIMQDHAMASYNAAISVFPNVKVLMCYNHVKAQIFKHRNLIVDERYKGLMNDLSDLHYLKILANIVRRKLNSK